MVECGNLPFETVDAAENPRFVQNLTRISNQISCLKVVCTVDYDVISADYVDGISCIETTLDSFYYDLRVEVRNPPLSRCSLRFTDL